MIRRSEPVSLQIQAGALMETEKEIHYMNCVTGSSPHPAVGHHRDRQAGRIELLQSHKGLLRAFHLITRH